MILQGRLRFFILGLFLLGSSPSLKAYNNPYSIVYCPGDTSYYIANTGDNTILRRDAAANLTIFATAPNQLNLAKGMATWESADLTQRYLYVTNAGKIHVFNLITGQQDSSITVNGASTLAGLVIDNNGTYLYAADYTTNKVYRIDRVSGQDTILINSGLFMPYALYLDVSVNRLMIASSDPINATIKTYFITTGNLITTVPNPPKQLTGITRDGEGYWYVSSWITDKVYRYHPSLIPAPTEVIVPMGIVYGPTGVYCNNTGNPDILVIPSTFNHQVYFLPVITLGEPGMTTSPDNKLQIFPNPGLGQSSLRFYLEQASQVKVLLYDMSGRYIYSLCDRFLGNGEASIALPAFELPAGTYLLEVNIQGTISRKKWILNPR